MYRYVPGARRRGSSVACTSSPTSAEPRSDSFVERVAAIINVRDGMEVPSLEDVQAECRKHIAGYKVPREIHVTDVVPRTPVGKPDYRWAKRLALGEPA